MGAPTYYAVITSGAVTGKTVSLDETVPSGGLAVTAEEFASIAAGSSIVSGAVVTGTYPQRPSGATAATTLLAGGLAITSTGTPSLNHTYAADAATIAQIRATLDAGGNAPFGFVWPAKLVNGTWIDTGSSAHLTAIYGVLCMFNCCCNAIINGVTSAPTPSSSATIA